MPEHKDRMTDMRKTLTAELGQNLNEIEERSRAELHKGYERNDPKPPASAGEEG
jgi:choline-sulfatase